MPRVANETKPRQFRLSESIMKKLDEIKEELGLDKRTEALRVAINIYHQQIVGANKNPEKSRKK